MAVQRERANGTGTGTGAGAGERAPTPDVVLDVSSLSVDEITIEVDRLHARIALDARLGDLVELHVGADVDISDVALELKGVQAEAHLRANLDTVAAIMGRALDSVDEHPEMVLQLGRHVDEEGDGDGGDGDGALERLAPSARAKATRS